MAIDLTQEVAAIREGARGTLWTESMICCSVSVLQGPDAGVRSLIAGCGRNAHFDAGSYLLREGEPPDRFFTIRGGSVAVET